MSTMNTPRDLPPPYSSLDLSTTNIAILEEAVPHYEADDRAGLLDNTLFEDKTTRIGFIQKVLATKLLQLLVICAVMGLFVVNRWAVIRFLYEESNLVHLIVLSTMIHILIYALLVCCHKARRQNPYQYLFLVAYPLSLSLCISIWTVYWEILEPILLSFVYYCVFVFVLLMINVYACQTKLDFDTKYGILAAIVTQFVMYAFTVPFLNIEPVFVLYPTIIMLLEYIYILFDIEAMTSKTYWYSIKPDDYIDGTLNLHIDYFNVLYNSKMVTALKTRMTRFGEILDV